MINANIPLMGQMPDIAGAVNNGLADGGGLAKLLISSQVNRMRDLDTDNERKAFADKNFFGRQLRSQLKQDQASAFNAQLQQRKAISDIEKTQSEAFKNNTQSSGYGLDNAGKMLASADKALMVGAQNGDPMAVKLALNNALKAGAIDPDTFNQYNQQIDVLSTDPEAVKAFASSIVFANAKDPASLMYTSADNRLDNQTSITNNVLDNQTSANNNIRTNQVSADNSIRSTNASMYSTDKSFESNQNRLEQDQNQFNKKFEFEQQQADIKNQQGEIKEFGGKAYIVYKDGSFKPALDATGQHITSAKAETPEQKMERMDNVLGAEDAHRSAMRAVKDAKDLMNHPGLYWGTGATSLLGSVPGTDAKEFQAQIENLKSQVFLPAVKAMQGMGALSNAEGEKISASIANLDSTLSPDAMKKQLNILAEQMQASADLASKKMQNYASRGGNIPLAQTPQNQPQGDRPPLSSLFK